MKSLNEHAREGGGVSLPDFRNPGVVLRTLLLAEAANVISLIAHSPDGMLAVGRLAASIMPFEASLLAIVLALVGLAPWLKTLEYRTGVAVVVGISVATAVGLELFVANLQPGLLGSLLRISLVTAALTMCLVVYFNWRHRVLSPALIEARLLALQSRIRPHFLFNSLNAAVSVVRSDPRLAERVLLDLCDLFRALLADGRSLVPLADEIRLAKAYLEVEALRLGERLAVVWRMDSAPENVLVPVLMLQPLLENAVYHGIELRPDGGTITVQIDVRRGRMGIEVRNPVCNERPVPVGNRMALANIRERLALHFDADAVLKTDVRDGEFVVRVELPGFATGVLNQTGLEADWTGSGR